MLYQEEFILLLQELLPQKRKILFKVFISVLKIVL